MTSAQPLRFGLIGVDSSHALQFTRLFRDGLVADGVVTTAWRGPEAEDFPPGRRAEAHATELPGLGVQLLDSPEAVAEASDALLVVSADARTRLAQFARVAPFGLPVYPDTRFSAGVEETERMLRIADETGTLVLSGSPKRFTPGFRPVRETAGIERLDLTGALVEQPGHEGLAWYGVHLVDLAVAAFGPGCRLVEPDERGLRLIWDDGRIATIAGPAEWVSWTSGTARRGDARIEFAIEANANMLTGLLDSIVAACRTGLPNITPAEIREISAIVAAGSAALRSGAPVSL